MKTAIVRFTRAACAAFLAGVVLAPLAGATSAEVNTSTQKSTGFEDGNLSPFYSCNTTLPSIVQPFTKDGVRCLKSYWTQSTYNGTRNTKGAEACASYATYKEGWFGFKLYVPSPGYPTNKEAAVAQIFQHGNCNSWAGHLVIKNNSLLIVHRSSCGSATSATIVSNIPRNSWRSVVVHFKASRVNGGLLEVYYNGSRVYYKTGINFGFGVWNSNDTLASGNQLGLKIGQYCYDNNNYSTGETRTLYYDNVCWLVGNPSGAMATVTP
jgi:hypothetical protein